MTALDRIRRRIGPADGTTPRAFVELETVRAMLVLVGAVKNYQAAAHAWGGLRDVNTIDAVWAALDRLEALP